MKTRILSLCLVILAVAAGCTQGQNKKALEPQAFAEKIKSSAGATVIDVRTAEEFSEGHLAGAMNFDWNGGHFEHLVMNLDKSKAVLVYCTKGGRSASAAQKMRSMGFKEVIELDGGLDEWQAAKLPVIKN